MNDRKKALVTGGATGIGRSAVLALAKAGYDVAINYASSAKAAKEVAALAQGMGAQTMLLACDVSDEAAVRAITVHDDHVVLNGDGVHCTAARVIVAAPPRVVARDITFAPPLSDTVVDTLRGTVTWMGHAMKCVATYDRPFWRDDGRSGYAVSWGGPLQEIHDACMPPHDGMPAGYALMGFVAPRTSAAARAFRDASAEGPLGRGVGLQLTASGGWSPQGGLRASFAGSIASDSLPLRLDEVTVDVMCGPGASGTLWARDPSTGWWTIEMAEDCTGCGPASFAGVEMGEACVGVGLAAGLTDSFAAEWP